MKAFCFLFLSLESPLQILNTSPLSDLEYSEIFSVCGQSFHSLNSVFQIIEALNMMKSSLSIFCLYGLMLWCCIKYLKNIYITKVCTNFILWVLQKSCSFELYIQVCDPFELTFFLFSMSLVQAEQLSTNKPARQLPTARLEKSHRPFLLWIHTLHWY